MFGKVVIDDQNVFALGHELFGHGATGVGRDVLHGSGIGSPGGDDDRVFHGAGQFQGPDNLSYLALLLADGHVDADQVPAFLVDDGVQRDGCLAGGAVADD